jgi:hypothetical protein
MKSQQIVQLTDYAILLFIICIRLGARRPYYEQQYGIIGQLYYLLGFHHLYGSWWYMLLIASIVRKNRAESRRRQSNDDQPYSDFYGRKEVPYLIYD